LNDCGDFADFLHNATPGWMFQLEKHGRMIYINMAAGPWPFAKGDWQSVQKTCAALGLQVVVLKGKSPIDRLTGTQTWVR
jgi:hypothetical protein